MAALHVGVAVSVVVGYRGRVSLLVICYVVLGSNRSGS